MNNKFNEDGARLYHIDEIDKDLPSVTTILSLMDNGKTGALMGWAVKVMADYLKSLANAQGHILITSDEVDEVFKKAKTRHKELKEKAGDIGSEIHNLIEVYLKGQSVSGLLETNKALIKPFEAFLSWQSEYNLKAVKTEHIVWSELGYAGTLDIVGTIKDKLYIVDLKSSNRINEEYFMQVAAYLRAYEERENCEIEGAGILRLGKEDGLPEWKEIPLIDIHDYMDMFMCLCSLWHAQRRRKK